MVPGSTASLEVGLRRGLSSGKRDDQHRWNKEDFFHGVAECSKLRRIMKSLCSASSSGRRQKTRGDVTGNIHETLFFIITEIMRHLHADAECAAEAGPIHHWHRETALDLSDFGSGLGHATGVRLQIAQLHRLLALGGSAGDALAHGDGLNDRNELGRDGLIGDEFEMPVSWVEAVQCASGAAEFTGDLAEELIPISGGWGLWQ
jgi:hypothetical protein